MVLLLTFIFFYVYHRTLAGANLESKAHLPCKNFLVSGPCSFAARMKINSEDFSLNLFTVDAYRLTYQVVPISFTSPHHLPQLVKHISISSLDYREKCSSMLGKTGRHVAELNCHCV